VVRRFVKPVTDVERAPEGVVLALSGQPVTEVGPDRRPILSAATAYLDCRLTRADALGSHVFCVGEVIGLGGEPAEVLRMEDTRMHYGG
jgi:flavin reductase (DIM6/NTAB) family NADH-FMN oxidoreductase RutF